MSSIRISTLEDVWESHSLRFPLIRSGSRVTGVEDISELVRLKIFLNVTNVFKVSIYYVHKSKVPTIILYYVPTMRRVYFSFIVVVNQYNLTYMNLKLSLLFS